MFTITEAPFLATFQVNQQVLACELQMELSTTAKFLPLNNVSIPLLLNVVLFVIEASPGSKNLDIVLFREAFKRFGRNLVQWGISPRKVNNTAQLNLS